MTESNKNYHKMENNDINETEESVCEFTSDDNTYSFKLIDSKEKHVKIETEVIGDCVFHSIIEIPRATDQSKFFQSLGDDEFQYPPKDFFLNYNSRLNTDTFHCFVCKAKFKSELDLDQHVEKNHKEHIKVPVQNVATQIEVHDESYYEEYLRNIELVPVPEYNSLRQPTNIKLVPFPENEYFPQTTNIELVPVPEHESMPQTTNIELVPVPKYESLPQIVVESSMLCRKCGIKFERMDLYTRHINSCRKRLYEKNYGNDNKFAKKTTINSTYSTVTDRKLTLRSHSNITAIKPEPIELDFGNGHTVDNIKEEPTSKHKCNVCQKQFVYANNLTKHMHIHAAIQMSYRCQLCYRGFMNRGHLTNHMKGSQCPVKKEQLSTRNDKNLEILVNSRARNFQTRKVELAAHNTIQNKFKCDDCGERFSSNYFLEIHNINRH